MTTLNTKEVKNTISIFDKSAKALAKGTIELDKAVSIATLLLATLDDTSKDLASDIETKSIELAQIQENTGIAVRKAKNEFDLQIDENKTKVLAQLMKERGFAEISIKELSALRSELEDAVSDNKAAIDKAVAIATSAQSKAHDANDKETIAAHSVETAELKAKISSLQFKETFLTDNAAKLEKRLNDELSARVDMSKNQQPIQVNVPSSK